MRVKNISTGSVTMVVDGVSYPMAAGQSAIIADKYAATVQTQCQALGNKVALTFGGSGENYITGAFHVGTTFGEIVETFGEIKVAAGEVEGCYMITTDTYLIGKQIISAEGNIGKGVVDASAGSQALAGLGNRIDSNYVNSRLGLAVIRSIKTESPYTPEHVADSFITVTLHLV